MFTLIKNAYIVNYDEKFHGDILIEDGIIKEVGEHVDFQGEGATIIDANGEYVFPGFIDTHTHPGLPEDLGFKKNTNDMETETLAAFMGGTTTIFDFAEPVHGERLIDAYNKRLARYKGKARCKVQLHMSVIEVQDDIYEQLEEVKKLGVKSVKLYTTYGMMMNNSDLLKVMDCCAKLDLIALVHCEEDSIIQHSANAEDFEATRPAEAEATMVYTIINFAKLTGCTAYICHVSSRISADLIIKAKEDGVPVYFETCPHYLIFDKNKFLSEPKEMVKFVLSPPFRKKEDNKELIKACLNGDVDVISTDHCAFLYKEHKEKFADDINKVAKGMPGLQLRPSAIYDILVDEHKMPVEDFVKLLSYNQARIFGLEDRGYIKPGMLADLVIWNKDKFKVTINEIFEGTDYTPYEGMTLTGRAGQVLMSPLK